MTTSAEPRRHGRARASADAPPAVLRVAAYCRKSVDKGSQPYGSIDAQRDAVASYVASQRGLGWTLLPDRFDDLGISGKTTDRPGFRRLLEAVRAGEVDIVVCYRLDRLSRSQRDFLNTLDLFERFGVKFASVTEHFDTTTPMGRFALGILIQVAQLEREVTAERVRDKVLASRRKGLWCGGTPRLGYDSRDGKLVVNVAEAKRVREVFDLFLQLGSIGDLLIEIRRRGWTNKRWKNTKGCVVGGTPLTNASLRSMLTSPLYVGAMQAGDEIVEGAHEAIVDRETWEQAQRLFSKRPEYVRQHKWSAPLGGLLFCGTCGARMQHHFTGKGSRKYRFYVCARKLRQGADACAGGRVPAAEIEAFALEQVRVLGRDKDVLAATLAAAAEQAAAHEGERAGQIAELEAQHGALSTQQRHLVQAISRDGSSRALTRKLVEVESEIAEGQRRLGEIRAAPAARAPIDEAGLRAALRRFDDLWNELRIDEQGRVLAALIEAVRYDAIAHEVQISYRPEGVRLLAVRREPSP